MRTEYQELIDEVCALLGTPATLESRDFGLIAYGAHDSADDRVMDPVRTRSILHRRSTDAVREWFEGFGIARARRPVRIPPDPGAGVLTGRVCVPVRHVGVVYGYIWLLDDGALALDDARLVAVGARAERIGALLAAEARQGARLGELLREALRRPAGQGPEGDGALAAVLGPSAKGQVTVVAVLPGDAALPVPARVPGALALCEVDPSSLRPGGARPRPPDGAAVALAALVRPGSARTVAGRVRADGGAVAGVGGTRTGVADLAAVWWEALGAARAARAEGRFGGVAEWTAIGPYRLLATLPDAAPDPAVRPLLRPEHGELAHTAETFLDHAGRASGTAAALGVHRQTLYYRLSRIERLTGLDLARGEDRLLLHIALKAVRLRSGHG